MDRKISLPKGSGIHPWEKHQEGQAMVSGKPGKAELSVGHGVFLSPDPFRFPEPPGPGNGKLIFWLLPGNVSTKFRRARAPEEPLHNLPTFSARKGEVLRVPGQVLRRS